MKKNYIVSVAEIHNECISSNDVKIKDGKILFTSLNQDGSTTQVSYYLNNIAGYGEFDYDGEPGKRIKNFKCTEELLKEDK